MEEVAAESASEASENRDEKPSKMPWEGLEPPDPSPEGWQAETRAEYGINFKLPAHWNKTDGSGVFFATPPSPEDDSVVIFMGLDNRKGLDEALGKLDQVFPMTNVRFSIQNREGTINDMPMTFGEGVGYSKDFKADLHFFIMLVESGQHLTLMAAFVKQDVFESRSPTIIEIIRSMERQ
jgi:hypothetical protein